MPQSPDPCHSICTHPDDNQRLLYPPRLQAPYFSVPVTNVHQTQSCSAFQQEVTPTIDIEPFYHKIIDIGRKSNFGSIKFFTI